MFHHSISMKYKDFLKGKGPITDDVPSIGLWTAFEIPCNSSVSSVRAYYKTSAVNETLPIL